jgi:hypothetical protein
MFMKWDGDLRERDNLQGLSLDWKIILKWMFMKWDGDMDWFDVVQDRNSWRSVGSAVSAVSAVP